MNFLFKIFIAFFLAFGLFSPGIFAQVTLDSTFGNNGIVIIPAVNGSEINAIALQLDGKIVAAGYWASLGIYHFQIARYNIDGTLDNTFGNGGFVNTTIHNSDMPKAIGIQPNGKIIVAGYYYTGTPTSPGAGMYHKAIVRYNPDGTLDQSFGTGGILTPEVIGPTTHEAISSLLIQPDNKIVVGGSAGNQFSLIRFNNDGTPDNSFGTGGFVLTSIEAAATIYTMVLQPDNKIVVAGSTLDSIINVKFALARYNSDGSLDLNFGANGIITTDFGNTNYEVCHSLALQPDNKIIAAGYFGNILAVVRYNTNGSLDNNFGNAGIVTDSNLPGAVGVGLQSDGKIVVAGQVVVPTYDYGYSITRFNTDGIPDSSFGTGSNIIVDIRQGNDYAQCLIIQPDNKIIVAGSSRDGPSIPADFTLIRLTSDVVTGTTEIIPHIDDVKLYPNPVRNNIVIKIDNEIKIENIVLYDIKGKIIAEYSPEERNLNLSQISQGLYLLSITTERGIFNQPIVKL
ncbi:MAG: T9SS type A sorting domain-containing protein [Bacteroidia bacterium]